MNEHTVTFLNTPTHRLAKSLHFDLQYGEGTKIPIIFGFMGRLIEWLNSSFT